MLIKVGTLHKILSLKYKQQRVFLLYTSMVSLEMIQSGHQTKFEGLYISGISNIFLHLTPNNKL